MKDIFEAICKRNSENAASVLVTIIVMKGSTPGKAGFKMLVGAEGRIAGTIGGGGVEYHAINKSMELLHSSQDNLLETLVMKDSMSGLKEGENLIKQEDEIKINSLCGGEVILFYEVYRPAKTIYIFGAGHVGREVARFAKQLGFFVSVYDNRKEIIDELPCGYYNEKNLKELQVLPEKEKGYIKLDIKGFAVILTHNHANDLQVLEFICKNYSEMNYIGMIGSKRKVKEGITYLKKKMGESLDLKNLYAPIGIDCGGDKPAEIALSILAQIQSISYGKKQQHLRINYDQI